MEALFIKILNMSLAASGLILAAMALRLALRRAPLPALGLGRAAAAVSLGAGQPLELGSQRSDGSGGYRPNVAASDSQRHSCSQQRG